MAKTLTDIGIQKIGRRFVDSVHHANYTLDGEPKTVPPFRTIVLEAGYTVFLFLAYNDPAHLLSELPAGFTLHWDISLVLLIVIHLFCSGYSI